MLLDKSIVSLEVAGLISATPVLKSFMVDDGDSITSSPNSTTPVTSFGCNLKIACSA
jgi:hypothetical protein